MGYSLFLAASPRPARAQLLKISLLIFAVGLLPSCGTTVDNPTEAGLPLRSDVDSLQLLLACWFRVDPDKVAIDESTRFDDFEKLTRSLALLSSTTPHLNPLTLEQFLARQRNWGPGYGLLTTEQNNMLVVLRTLSIDHNLYLQVLDLQGVPTLVDGERVAENSDLRIWSPSKQQHWSRQVVSRRTEFGSFEIDHPWLNFGEVSPMVSAATQFTITNTGTSTLSIEQPMSSCGCVLTQIKEGTILKAGEALEIEAAIETLQSEKTRQTIAFFVRSNDAESRKLVQIPLLANQRASLQFSPTHLDFGLINPPCKDGNELPSRTVRISEAATDRFEIESVCVNDLPLEYSLETQSRPNGLRDYYIKFQWLEERPLSQNLEGMQLVSSAPSDLSPQVTVTTSSQLIPEIQLPIKSHLQSTVEIAPNSWAVGLVQPSDSIQQQFRISSHAPGELSVKLLHAPEGIQCTLLPRTNRGNGVMLQAKGRLNRHGILDDHIRVKVECGQVDSHLEIPVVGFVSGNRDSNKGPKQ